MKIVIWFDVRLSIIMSVIDSYFERDQWSSFETSYE